MTAFVVDASVAVKWVVDEAGSEAAARLAEHRLIAADLMLTESVNALWAKARRGELTEEEALERAQLLTTAAVELVPQTELLPNALALSFELDHPVYDCLYVALALERDLQVVTADRRFHAAVERDGRYEARVRLLGK